MAAPQLQQRGLRPETAAPQRTEAHGSFASVKGACPFMNCPYIGVKSASAVTVVRNAAKSLAVLSRSLRAMTSTGVCM